MLLLLGAIAIFGRFTLTINNSRYTNEFWIIQSEAQMVATSLAAGILETAAAKAFDEVTQEGFFSGQPTDLTAPSQLGAESGENYPAYDDIDDYEGLNLEIIGANGIRYEVVGRVRYVSGDNPASEQTSQTYFKKLTVTVQSEFMPFPVAMSRVCAYYHSGV